MKITVLTKRLSTNVIAISAAEALRLFLESGEADGAVVNQASVARVAQPNAAQQTVAFVEQSGVHVLGYFPELAAHLVDNPSAVEVWAVTMDLEFVVEFTPEQPENQQSKPGSVVGSIGREDVTDPNDRAGLETPAPSTPPVGATAQSSVTEGDI